MAGGGWPRTAACVAQRPRLFLLAATLTVCLVVASLFATESGRQLRTELVSAADGIVESLFEPPPPPPPLQSRNWTAIAADAAARCAAAAEPPGSSAGVPGWSTHWAVVAADAEAVRTPGVELTRWLRVTSTNAAAAGAGAPLWSLVIVEEPGGVSSDAPVPVAPSGLSGCEPPRCVYLSVAAQEALGYRVAALILRTGAARKNIGYVYAVAHGARVLYDGDLRTAGAALAGPASADTSIALTVVLNATNELPTNQRQPPVYNVLAYFQPAVPPDADVAWLRGFHATWLAAIQDGDAHELVPADGLRIGIEQGLILGSGADWDGMYRLTHRLPSVSASASAHVQRPPLILGAGTFSPLNGRSTRFHYAALWAALLPVSVHARVADIWRGYWAQRLMWDLGRHVVYHTTSDPDAAPGGWTEDSSLDADAVFEDFRDEAVLYNSASELVRHLAGWRAADKASFFGRVVELTETLVAAGLWASVDAELTHAWLLDLLDTCYVVPVAHDHYDAEHDDDAVDATRQLSSTYTIDTAAEELVKWVVVVSEHARPPTGWLDNYCRLSANWTTLVVEHVPWANASEWALPIAQPAPSAPPELACFTLTLSMQQEAAWALGLPPHQPLTAALRRSLGHLHVLTGGVGVDHRLLGRTQRIVIADMDARDRIRGGRVYELGDVVTNVTAPDINLVRWRPVDADHLLADVYGHFGWPGVRLPGTCGLTEAAGAWVAYNATQQLAPLLRDPVLMIVQGLTDVSPDIDPGCGSSGPASAGQQFFINQPRSRRFCADVPAVQLDRGLFSVLNARNAIFYPEALPLLWLPWLAPSDPRRADLLRGFLAQRLLWDSGHSLVIQSPTTELDEAFLASSSGTGTNGPVAPESSGPNYDWTPLLHSLRSWAGTAATPAQRQIELVDALVSAGHLAPVNRVLVRTWLARIQGYDANTTTTTIAIHNVEDEKDAADTAALLLAPGSALESRLNRCAWRWRWSPTLHSTFRSVMVGVHFNRPHMETLRTYLDLYAPAFPNIVLWGLPPVALTARAAPPYDVRPYLLPASGDNGGWGWLQHRAIVATIDTFPGYSGYLHTNDDMFLNYWRLARYDQSRPWYSIALNPAEQDRFEILSEGAHHNTSRWHWFSHIRMMQSVLYRLPCWAFQGSYLYLHTEHLLVNNDGSGSRGCVNPFALLTGSPADANITTPTEFHFFSGRGDFVYIPASSSNKVAELWRGAMANLMMEIAIPSAVLFTYGNLTDSIVQYTNVTYGSGFRPPYTLASDLDSRVDCYHPTKLSDPEAVSISQAILDRDSRPL